MVSSQNKLPSLEEPAIKPCETCFLQLILKALWKLLQRPSPNANGGFKRSEILTSYVFLSLDKRKKKFLYK